MRITRLYYSGKLSLDSNVSLDHRQSHYLYGVLRLSVGRSIILFNGTGGEYYGHIQTIAPKNTIIALESYQSGIPPSPTHIELGQSLLRAEKMDYVLQKSVELGVNCITPLLTERNDITLHPQRIKTRLSHWSGIIISACEQSGRTDIPTLLPPQTLTDWLATPRDAYTLLCQPSATQSLADLVQEIPQIPRIAMLIGPAGGFSGEEQKKATLAGCLPLSLGPRILRTETAAMTALSLLQYLYGDLAMPSSDEHPSMPE